MAKPLLPPLLHGAKTTSSAPSFFDAQTKIQIVELLVENLEANATVATLRYNW
jgi:hypothetical protein